MQQEIDDYSKAVADHIKAVRDEFRARDKVQKTRYKLNQAKNAMRMKELDLMDLTEIPQ